MRGGTPGRLAASRRRRFLHVYADRRAPLCVRLFADLVGFTSLSESRDAEEVRDLLSRYFEECRRLIGLYSGTVEKFIGDAVMAVWGWPVAQEDDAERAVRAALDLVEAVAELGAEIGAPDLMARAGVLTGEAAVMPGGLEEGAVAGDLVNTASRVQSVAEPGMVLVGESTKRATEAAIAYEDAGLHALKGKSEPLPLFRALRVTAARRGAVRSSGLEPPFVGRTRELRMLKELFHASAEERTGQLVSVTGLAGIGKSRLSWEFEKYIDGVGETVFWHRGRCLSYGEGVAYWALAEMVRMRCGIAEDEEPGSAIEKLRATTQQNIPDEDERRWVEPRLAHLLGLEEGVAGDQENLFSAWRILFERLAAKAPTILVFEDMQWADTGLLDFLEYLLEWSRHHPLFVVALARPELADKRPDWGVGKRSFASVHLEPLAPEAMSELLTGLVPGLPDELRGDILARAEGIPLYAVETVRMLLGRGLLAQEGNVYRLTGPVETLEVPETLHALIAARLDSLTPEERQLVQTCAVLGKTFTKQGLQALTRLTPAELDPLLRACSGRRSSPSRPTRARPNAASTRSSRTSSSTSPTRRSPRRSVERSISRRRSSSRPFRAQRRTRSSRSSRRTTSTRMPRRQTTREAEEIRSKAREMLVRAGERAASLAAPMGRLSGRSNGRSSSTDEPLMQAELRERAGTVARIGGRQDEAEAHYERAIELLEAGWSEISGSAGNSAPGRDSVGPRSSRASR